MKHHYRSSFGRAAVLLAAAAALVLGFSSNVLAQAAGEGVTNYVPEGAIKRQEEEVGKGIDGTLGIAANLNLASNSNVVGQVDGFSMLFGANIIGGLDYIHGKHEFRNTLKVTESWAKTPVLDEWVKNNDLLDVESLYNYFLYTWMGPFARLNMQTSILPAEDIHAVQVDYAIKDSGGAIDNRFDLERLELAGAFSPLTFNESFGIFAEPLQTAPASIAIRLGAGARQTFADGVLVLSDDSATLDVIEVTKLDDVYQAGAEVFVGLRGKIMKSRLSYDAGMSYMIPFLNNDPQDRAPMDLARYGAFASASVGVFDWMSLNYQFKVLKDPQLYDELQVQNALLLSFQYTLIERDGPPPVSLEDKLKEAEERAKKAEERAASAEKQAQESAVEKVEPEVAPEPEPEVAPEPEPEPEVAPEPEPEVAPEPEAVPAEATDVEPTPAP